MCSLAPPGGEVNDLAISEGEWGETGQTNMSHFDKLLTHIGGENQTSWALPDPLYNYIFLLSKVISKVSKLTFS